MKIGILPLGRPTFDVPFAEENLSKMLAVLDQSGHTIVGPRGLLFDAEETQTAIETLQTEQIDRLLLLQVTFTDASMTVEAARSLSVPLSIWAIPEPRLGGRLRLNAFCGLNLASHALGLNEHPFAWAYLDPENATPDQIEELVSGTSSADAIELNPVAVETGNDGIEIARAILGKRIGRVGDHPTGFDTCAYDPDSLRALAGVSVDTIDLDELFDRARTSSPAKADAALSAARQTLSGLDQVDQAELDRSARLKVALDELRVNGAYDAFAIRCWPETFTEYGGAVCGPVSMLGEARVPCACEADVYGSLSQLILQEVAKAPVFLTDLVDMDATDDTGVVWHCGQAPISMCDPDVQPAATIHTNRKMPLLYEFPLKPGRVTLMRVSQSRNQPKMVVAGGEMLARPMAFTGTSGVVRFDSGAGAFMNKLIESGMEHHMALCYGDQRSLLRSVAGAMSLPVLEL